MDNTQEERDGGERRTDGPAFGGLPDPVDLSGYPVPEAAGVLAGVPAGAGSGVVPGTGAAALRAVRETADQVRGVGDGCGQLNAADLDEATCALLRVRQEAERSLVLALADAVQRDVVAASDSGGARQWLTDRAMFLEPAEASRLVVAAEAINRPDNRVRRGGDRSRSRGEGTAGGVGDLERVAQWAGRADRRPVSGTCSPGDRGDHGDGGTPVGCGPGDR